MECVQCDCPMEKISKDVSWCPQCGTCENDAPEPYNWFIPKIAKRPDP